MDVPQFLDYEKKLYQGIIERIDILINLYNYENSLQNDHHLFPQNNYLDQILFIINKENRFLHNKEISQLFLKYNKEHNDIVGLQGKISIILNKKKKTISNLVSYKYSKAYKDTVWGKKEWLDENNKPKEKHMYKERKKDDFLKSKF
ncbi:hypothetical protein ATE47_07500 [Chryseobacterium sp. IHB B 17019]|uniref:Uncharacterized protein n=2 Tax=Chryseobacterium TaxID=59732 RepID=A0ABT9SLA1_9FLAO|nr:MULTISPECIES: hypothetical protein [Chryseobacterium]ALR30376.1 hypothetical protein ATE47_07500 [Chryseobacterium sp. IHB B 17019]MCT2409580.1 hypothetical protein [Chryseobacterium pyrolae]MDP9959772.1 hypothetical protein [Chryseobacterium lathyri]